MEKRRGQREKKSTKIIIKNLRNGTGGTCQITVQEGEHRWVDPTDEE